MELRQQLHPLHQPLIRNMLHTLISLPGWQLYKGRSILIFFFFVLHIFLLRTAGTMDK